MALFKRKKGTADGMVYNEDLLRIMSKLRDDAKRSAAAAPSDEIAMIKAIVQLESEKEGRALWFVKYIRQVLPSIDDDDMAQALEGTYDLSKARAEAVVGASRRITIVPK